jgi:hypothetical protein
LPKTIRSARLVNEAEPADRELSPTRRSQKSSNGHSNTIPKDATHWTIRSTIADRTPPYVGFEMDLACSRILRAHSSSSNTVFSEKVRDIFGLYMSPPNRVVVLRGDEKPQNQGAGSRTAGSASRRCVDTCVLLRHGDEKNRYVDSVPVAALASFARPYTTRSGLQGS